MSTFHSIVGAVAVLLSAVGMVCLACGYLLEKVATYRWQADQRAKQQGLRDFGVTLCRLSYWFTESEQAWIALQCLGESLRSKGDFDVSAVREEWRKRLASKAGGAS